MQTATIIAFPMQPKSFIPPSIEEVKLHAAKIGLPDIEAEKLWYHFDSNGWKVGGKTRMKSWTSAMMSWKLRIGCLNKPKVKGTEKVISFPTDGRPTMAEVQDYAEEKWGNEKGFNARMKAYEFYVYWSYQNRNWRKNGRLIDWQIELQQNISKFRTNSVTMENE